MPLPARKTPRIVSPRKINAWGDLPREEQMIDVSRRFAWQVSLQWLRRWSPSSTTAIAQECRIAGSSTRSIATRTTTSSPTCRPIRKSCAIRPRSSSPTRPLKTRRSTRTCSSRSPIFSSVHRQAGRLLPGAIELGRDRGDALGSPPRRGLLDRTDGIRRQYGRRGSVRGQGHREGAARLPSVFHRQEGQPVPEALRSEGQARRAHVAVVEFRPPRAARAVPRRKASSPTRTTSR